ncbi:sulfurtransferase [Janibacter sp. GXQ6167]|uniref:sulfurtransferase n=1 Tax=Janibacter sp. GXQ6167 TaxID=3240791 RepID=UPI0035235887
MSALISPDNLAAHPDVVLLDVQYELMGTPSRDLYERAHLPGAQPLDLDSALAGPPGEGGRHPLPDPAILEAALRVAGVDDDSTVVVYDQASSLAAARAWWVLRWAGLTDVRVLDGGLAAWRASGRPVESGAAPPSPEGGVSVRAGSMPVIEADEVTDVARRGVLLDARAPERYRGDVEPIDPVAGHIPGAVNAPMADLLDDQQRLRPPAELRAYFADRGVTDDTLVGAYCGSGVTAAHTVLALHEAGIKARPYIGSWSHWVTDPTRPTAP